MNARTPVKTVVNYRVGTVSLAGFPILYDRSYSLEEAKAAVERGGATRVFKVTIEEV